MTTTTDTKFTLIYYRPNGKRYEGCGDYVEFDSEMEMFQDLSRDELRTEIKKRLAHADDCCDSCASNENPCEFAILGNGKPLTSMGDNFSSFQPSEETDETLAMSTIFDEARNLIYTEQQAKAEAKKKADAEAAQKKAFADAEAARARAKAAEEAERRQFEALKAKYEPKPEPMPEPLVKAVEKAKAELVTA